MKVAIVGGAPCETQRQIWDYGKGWEIWALNAIRPSWLPVPSRCFNLHRYAHLRRDWHDGVFREAAWANAHPEVPFYVVDKWPKSLLPNQMIFPIERLLAMPHGNYHAGSIDMMVAFAIIEGAKQITLHGIALTLESGEPIAARSCLEYWCGIAEGRGIRVTAAEDCDLFTQFHLVKSRTIYGYDDVKIIEDRT